MNLIAIIIIVIYSVFNQIHLLLINDTSINNLIKICGRVLINNSFMILLIIMQICHEYSEKYKIKHKKLDIYQYSKQIEYSVFDSVKDSQNECSICYIEYTKSDNIRKLNVCSHIFHKECIDKWIQGYNKKNCPICRANL
jgi:hypothetical protein